MYLAKQLTKQLAERQRRRWSRRAAPFMAALFGWSFTAGPVLGAFAEAPRPSIPAEQERGHVRRLSAAECERIAGSAASTMGVADTYPWEGSALGTNTWTGAKSFAFPLTGWTARGGLPVGFTMYYGSRTSATAELGPKWRHTYNISLLETQDPDSGAITATVTWGNFNEESYVNSGSGFAPAAGFHGALVYNSGSSSYDLTTPDQVIWHFARKTAHGFIGYDYFCTSITDRNGNSATIGYATGTNRPNSVTDPTSRALSIAFDGSNRVSTVTDPLSRVWTVTYTAGGEVYRITWPALSGTSYYDQFAYDAGANHRILTHTDKRGNAETFTYNSDSSVASETDACSNTTTFTYNALSTVIIDANSHSVTHGYDSAGNLTSVTDQASSTESRSYDSAHNMTGLTDRRGHSYSFTFDSNGSMLTKTDPLSHVWTWTWNTKNEVTSVVDPLGNEVDSGYDTPGNLTSVTEKNSGGRNLSI